MNSYKIQNRTYLAPLGEEIYASQTQYDYVLINPEQHAYQLIGSREAEVWKMLAAGAAEPDIIAEISVQSGKFEEKYVQTLLSIWREQGLIYDAAHPLPPKRSSWLKHITWIEKDIPNPDKWLSRFYRLIGWIFTTPLALILSSGTILAGFILGIISLLAGRVQYLTDIQLGEFILLFIVGNICLFLHELGHAISMKWVKAEVLRAGVALYLGLPVFFVDTSSAWVKTRRQRIITSAAGMYVNAFLAAVCIVLVHFTQDPFTRGFLWEVAYINIFTLVVSAIPFLKLDGYYILMDLIGIPKLQKEALSEVRKIVTGQDKQISTRDILLSSYAVISVISSVLLSIYAVIYWVSILGRIVG